LGQLDIYTELSAKKDGLPQTKKRMGNRTGGLPKPSLEKLLADCLKKGVKQMTTLNAKVEEKQNMFKGKLDQAKGVVQEQWDQISNEELPQLADKKERFVEHLQENYGDSWVVQHKTWVLVGMAVLVVMVLITKFRLGARRRSE
jgi:uncharacterized protein YjbJ (UPF0337 family)